MDGIIIELPERPFLFTLDQIATMLSISEEKLKKNGHIYFVGRSVGKRQTGQLEARNISDSTSRPEWRVSEVELKRWMKYRGFRIVNRSYYR